MGIKDTAQWIVDLCKFDLSDEEKVFQIMQVLGSIHADSWNEGYDKAMIEIQ